MPDEGAAARRVITQWEANPPDSVFCYVSGADECATDEILSFCLKRGIPLAVPFCEERGVMTARIISSLSQLKQGYFGLMEPPKDAPVLETPDLVIVPGLAFDREGFRLGRGGGYYDRWLAGFGGDTIGLCRNDRLLEHLPRDAWDVPVCAVVTEWQTLQTQKSGG